MLRTQQMGTIFLQQLSWQVFISSHLDPPQTLLFFFLISNNALY
jgi:hypothetical protein